ncbi:MAG: ribosomal-processing cysteine protease Prp, partial [Erysipelotrichaceae bacterium]
KICIQTQNEKVISLNIKGHAEYKEYGEDTVCAGVSSIAIGLLNALDLLNAECTCSMDNNKISVLVNNRDNEQTQIILKTGIIQLETIQESYEAFIKLSKQEV